MKWLAVILVGLVFASGCVDITVFPEDTHGKSDVNEVLGGVPNGWTGSVIEPGSSFPCPDKEVFFDLKFEYPPVVCEVPAKGGGTLNVSPSFRLHYYEKFAPEDWEDYVVCISKLFATAVAMPFKFAETEKHTIMTTGGDYCPEKDYSEIENYLNEYYDVI